MRIKCELRWIHPSSTNTKPPEYEGIITAIGTEQEIKHFRDYLLKYKVRETKH